MSAIEYKGQENRIRADKHVALQRGLVIPAHPLALTGERRLDERSQAALTRYYIDAGSGGLAVGVHSTQFEIREAGLYEPVLALAMDTARNWTQRDLVMIAGLSGQTGQARNEARTAHDLGYDAGLLSLAALRGASEDAMIEHCAAIAEIIPLVGFYLQTAVGGVLLPASFWRRFAALENVVAIKVAPFNRYRTLDVVRGVVEAGAENRIALYTGNDDNILHDLLTPYRMRREGNDVVVRFCGGLLGHWNVWVRKVVELHHRIQSAVESDHIDADLLALAGQITDCNAALFDVANDFRGCIAGCHEVLYRQGLMQGPWCLDPNEQLSPGQRDEIDRVMKSYPHLLDDAFVARNLDRWLNGRH